MSTLQKWFERLAGITPDALERERIACQVFTRSQSIDPNALQLPACWRRAGRPH